MLPTTMQVLAVAEMLTPTKMALEDAEALIASHGWTGEELRHALAIACGLIAGVASRLDAALNSSGTLAELMLSYALEEAVQADPQDPHTEDTS